MPSPSLRFLFGSLLLLIACSQTESPPGVDPDNWPEPKPGTAVVQGRILFEGEAPENPRVEELDVDSFCLMTHKDGLTLPQIQVDASQGLADVLVFVRKGVQSSRPPESAVSLNQRGCLFEPRVLALQVGQTLLVHSEDDTLHNVRISTKDNPSFNRAMIREKAQFEHVFQHPEFPIPVRCDVHSWMAAWIGVFPHPYFAVTPATGNYSIPALPAGDYTFETWHPELGSQTKSLTLQEGETLNLDWVFRL